MSGYLSGGEAPTPSEPLTHISRQQCGCPVQMEVGIRKLRDHLSRYVDLVQSGTELTVTDHGRAVAQMTPLNGPWQFDRLVAGGLITRSAAKK